MDAQDVAYMLKQGHIIVLNTDTVVGIACCPLRHSIERVYEYKRRDTAKPLIWLVGSKKEAISIWGDAPEIALGLMSSFWPGALTIVAASNNSNSIRLCKSADGNIGVRQPNAPELLALLDICGPLLVTSANVSGEEPLHSVFDAQKIWPDIICWNNDSDTRRSQTSSTIVFIGEEGHMEILRQGDVTVITE